jgi:hypothetical protein
MAGLYDEFEIINGPEDGSLFPLVRVPAYLGAGADCAVQIATDPAVLPRHVCITAASSGFRLRLVEGGGVMVNGRRAGRLFSRIAREGDVVRVGNTYLVLRTSPEGLARRSMGLAPDSDFLFALGKVGRMVRLLLRGVFRSVRGVFRNVISMIITVLVIAVLLSFFVPGLRLWMGYYLQVLRAYVNQWVNF